MASTPVQMPNFHRKLNAKKLATKAIGEEDFDNHYTDLAQYGKARFWDHRYTEDQEPFDWYYGYEKYENWICQHIAKELNVLIAGCGNSHFIEDMADDGFENLVGVDISRVVISQMQVRCADFPQITFIQANLLDSNLPDKSYDAIIDKALFDSILCAPGGDKNIAIYMFEVERILNDQGVFFLVTYGNPEDRLKYLEQYDLDEPYFTPWYVTVQAVEIPPEYDDELINDDNPDSYYWVYICKKNEELVRKKKERLEFDKEKARRAKKTRKGAFPL